MALHRAERMEWSLMLALSVILVTSVSGTPEDEYYSAHNIPSYDASDDEVREEEPEDTQTIVDYQYHTTPYRKDEYDDNENEEEIDDFQHPERRQRPILPYDEYSRHTIDRYNSDIGYSNNKNRHFDKKYKIGSKTKEKGNVVNHRQKINRHEHRINENMHNAFRKNKLRSREEVGSNTGDEYIRIRDDDKGENVAIMRRRPREKNKRKLEVPPDIDDNIPKKLDGKEFKSIDTNEMFEKIDARQLLQKTSSSMKHFPYRRIENERENIRHPPQQTINSQGDDYEDKDMKRIYRIKNRLPGLLQRTTVKLRDERLSSTSTERLEEKADGGKSAIQDDDDKIKINSVTITRRTPKILAQHAKASYTLAPEFTPTRSSITSISSSSTISTTEEISSTIILSKSQEELSIAEKSRLSVLKKAQRKESFNNQTTTKPPVLIQVTQKLHTIVMIEPRSTMIEGEKAFKGAHENSDDSPERLQQVKRLMRHKLISRSKGFEELTDDWDEMICDYVDLALLETSKATKCQAYMSTEDKISQSVAAVAEQQLEALLSGENHTAGRKRKEIRESKVEMLEAESNSERTYGSLMETSLYVPTFHPGSVDRKLETQWNDFVVKANCTRAVRPTLSYLFLVLLNYLQLYLD